MIFFRVVITERCKNKIWLELHQKIADGKKKKKRSDQEFCFFCGTNRQSFIYSFILKVVVLFRFLYSVIHGSDAQIQQEVRQETYNQRYVQQQNGGNEVDSWVQEE